VAGQFPKFEACFTPAEDVKQPRAYFKATGDYWYWVDFKKNTEAAPASTAAASTASCYTAILPKPTDKIDTMSYYLEVGNSKFEQSRTGDQVVDVMPKDGTCKKDKIAGFVPNASVAVGAPAGAPAVPLGFGGVLGAGTGLGAGAIAGGVAVAGGATGGVIAATNGGGGGSATPTATVSATGTPAPTATPIPGASPTNAPFSVKVSAAPTSGTDPLVVTFDACSSTGQNLIYNFDFDGDGTGDLNGTCSATRTYTMAGVSSGGGPKPLFSGTSSGGSSREYHAMVKVNEGVEGGGSETVEIVIHVDGTFFAKLDANPDTGPSPLTVNFSTCGSIGQSLQYEFDFESDGTVDLLQSGASCTASYTYTVGRKVGPIDQGRARAQFSGSVDASNYVNFTARVRVFEGVSGGQSHTFNVPIRVGNQFIAALDVNPDTGVDPLDVTFDACASQGVGLGYEFDFESDTFIDAFKFDTDCTITVTYTTCGWFPAGGQSRSRRARSQGTFSCPVNDYTATVRIFDSGGGSHTFTVPIHVDPAPYPAPALPDASGRVREQSDNNFRSRAAWVAILDGPRNGHAVVNGAPPMYLIGRGRNTGDATGVAGTNRIEFTVAEAGGAGSISFDLGPSGKLVTGSVRALSGDVVALTGTMIKFRLKGTAGESVSFTFESAP
jgi:hypothetical protein